MTRTPDGPVDVVYTWVDDRTPGYRELLSRYATVKGDDDPSRTRDNLDTLRYSMRSLERHAPWINRVYLFTCRPQVPDWLNTDHPRLSVVHHDEVIPPQYLPTFNSLAIISHLHLIPGLSRKFLYLEDDMMFLRSVTMADFVAPDGRQLVFEEPFNAPRLEEIANLAKEGGWNLAVANSNQLLDARYGMAHRKQVNHSPLLIDKQRWENLLASHPDACDCTRRSRFRAAGNLAPEFLYQHTMLAERTAALVRQPHARKTAGYVPLEDFWPLTAYKLWEVRRQNPAWVTLNDNFGKRPNRTTERIMRRQLHRWLPDPCAFERA